MGSRTVATQAPPEVSFLFRGPNRLTRSVSIRASRRYSTRVPLDGAESRELGVEVGVRGLHLMGTVGKRNDRDVLAASNRLGF